MEEKLALHFFATCVAPTIRTRILIALIQCPKLAESAAADPWELMPRVALGK